MNKYAILAYPASHSLSPLLHNAVFQKNNINSTYHRSEVSPVQLTDFMRVWKNDTQKKGLSVSVPHKESIIEYVNELTQSAKSIGAVNTVYKQDGKIVGENTDWMGFSKSLLEYYSPKQKIALVLGAGGATKAIIYALINLGIKKIYIWNRTQSKAETIAMQFGDICEVISDPYRKKEQADLIINTTSLGMKGELETKTPISSDFWAKSHTAYDIVYTPRETVFLRDCKKAGGVPLSGENMLLYQAIEQSKIFTQHSLSDEAILKSMQSALEKHEYQKMPWGKNKFILKEKHNILETIIQNKKTELYTSYEYWGDDTIQKGNFEFKTKLQNKRSTPHVIAEIKPASPSRGKIFQNNDTVESIAKLYTENGVSNISVLTDFIFFGATIQNIKKAKGCSPLPLLRKDFIIHPSQIYEASAFGASAILLMRSVLNSTQIQEFLNICTELGIDALVEVHDEQELRDVLENTTAEIIGVNNRNLKTLKINKNTFQTLYQKYHSQVNRDIIWVCESGLSSKEDIEKYAKDANAVLIGTGFLTVKNRQKKLQEIMHQL